ncbi:type II secretion system F family protein [Parvularcula sp. LCG005]|uniref:type II secretion system F family protein n=1 Tax=Parvularcula sp. LCG005 TaxID=3078805 RepID=UPI002943A4C8|nr:type II secretion system F family protein [Parvularcula sp. LCG005]WOI53567.1 type II secretion system F family protein [Parvularcula sp. LCG005]
MALSQQQLMVLIGGLVVVVVLLVLFSGSSSGNKATKRAQSLSGRTPAKKGKANAQDPTKDRRRHVAESLKKIEDKQKEESKKKKVSLSQRIDQAGYEFSERSFYMGSAICGLVLVCLGLITAQDSLVILAMGIVGGLGIPRWFLIRARKKRQKKFVEEFSNSIDVIVRGVKSGLPVNECLKIIARDAQSPVKEEFHLLVEGVRIGLSLEQSLERMYQRMPLNEVKFFSIVLTIQQQTGGNLADALGNLSNVLRARKMMLGKIAALSMEAKASAVILAAMPFFVSGMVYMSAPDYLAPLYTTTNGQFMLLGAGLWMLMGVFVMKNMISIKV